MKQEMIDEREEEEMRRNEMNEIAASCAKPLDDNWPAKDVRERKVKTIEIPNNSLN